jgi:hypothetical protein
MVNGGAAGNRERPGEEFDRRQPEDGNPLTERVERDPCIAFEPRIQGGA